METYVAVALTQHAYLLGKQKRRVVALALIICHCVQPVNHRWIIAQHYVSQQPLLAHIRIVRQRQCAAAPTGCRLGLAHKRRQPAIVSHDLRLCLVPAAEVVAGVLPIVVHTVKVVLVAQLYHRSYKACPSLGIRNHRGKPRAATIA